MIPHKTKSKKPAHIRRRNFLAGLIASASLVCLSTGAADFPTDKVNTTGLAVTDARYPRNRQALLQEWRQSQGVLPRRG